MRLGVDTGGTFTDLVGDDGRVVKVPSTPDDPTHALRAALGDAGTGTSAELLAHGTTVATNALLEGRGGRVALVAAGAPRRAAGGAGAAYGREATPSDGAKTPAVPNGVDAVAVCLLHAD